MSSDLAKLNSPVTSLEDAMSREYPPPVPEPCNDCPWRRVATPGWLGPYTADEWLAQIHGETPIACHKTIREGGGWSEKTRQCRGAAIMRANVCKSPWNRTIETGPEDTDTVFASNAEFKEHHG